MEKYKPSLEEVKKAEEMMSDKEHELSETRSEQFDLETFAENLNDSKSYIEKFSCEGCVADRIRIDILPFISSVSEKDLLRVVEETSQLIEKFENKKFKTKDVDEGTPISTKIKLIEAITRRIGTIEDEEVLKGLLNKILSYNLIEIEIEDKFGVPVRWPASLIYENTTALHAIEKSNFSDKDKVIYSEKITNWMPTRSDIDKPSLNHIENIFKRIDPEEQEVILTNLYTAEHSEYLLPKASYHGNKIEWLTRERDGYDEKKRKAEGQRMVRKMDIMKLAVKNKMPISAYGLSVEVMEKILGEK